MTPIDSSWKDLSKIFWDQDDQSRRSAGNRSETPAARWLRLGFRDFAAECSIRAPRTQKPNCRAFQELSIDVNFIETGIETSHVNPEKDSP